jgi:hypothetical protein
MAYIEDLYRTDDWLYATVYMATWCTVEIDVGITVACFATLRPLLRPRGPTLMNAQFDAPEIKINKWRIDQRSLSVRSSTAWVNGGSAAVLRHGLKT